ncbi:Ff.00g034100.m01.CDS01 [Fusarium sp. VM40]|nr:Ff.00g034100.m01.CDS01 [Fusarium sp. VM40]
MAPSLRGQQDNESVSSIDSFDPDPTVVQKTITRQEAIDQAEDFIRKISSLDFDQDALKPRMAECMSEPVLRVLPPDLKASVHMWCWHCNLEWFHKLSKFLDEDLTEWNYTVEVPNRRKDMALCDLGADILRSYVADLKPLRKRLPEPERRELVNKV